MMAGDQVKFCISQIIKCKISEDECDFNVLTVAFRALRNFCATGQIAQIEISKNSDILAKTKEIIVFLLNKPSHTDDLCLLVSLQFVANFLVENRQNQVLVWETFAEEFSLCLTYDEPRIKHCTTMIIYNILLDNEDILQEINEPLTEFIMLTQSEATAEYAVFVLELFICKTPYIMRQYGNLSDENRLTVLSVIESIQKNPEGRKYPNGMLTYLSHYFVTKSQCVLEMAASDMDAIKAQEVAQILNLINSIASSNDEYLKEIQTVEELLVTGVGLLGSVHAISKERGNQFSMLLKLAELEAEPTEAIQEHPGFGFKAALVRLVGNLCWKHKDHQDTAREMGAIPLILDCCNIDARNPLIIQWAVLAMRNLCEGNMENQRVVASVDRSGQVDSGRLSELGLLFNGASR